MAPDSAAVVFMVLVVALAVSLCCCYPQRPRAIGGGQASERTPGPPAAEAGELSITPFLT